MWRAILGSICAVAGLALVGSGAAAPASAGSAEARVSVADYVHVTDDGGAGGSPIVDSNVAVTVSVGDSGYRVTPR